MRAGENTLHPYDENPPNLTVQQDDIVFLDFGPILEEWEADYGRTYVVGDDPYKQKLAAIVSGYGTSLKNIYSLIHPLLVQNCTAIACNLAREAGWEYGGPIAGHLIGHFPHEQLDGEEKTNYIHPENHVPMNEPDHSGERRHWIIEIHLVDREKKIGSFFEQIAV